MTRGILSWIGVHIAELFSLAIFNSKNMRAFILCLTLLVVVTGCPEKQEKSMTVDITLRNCFSNALDWVELKWNGPYVPGGILSPGIESTTVGAEWTNISSAKLTFVDKTTRKPYSIDLSFPQINERVLSGKCHDIEIRILSYDKADVICK